MLSNYHPSHRLLALPALLLIAGCDNPVEQEEPHFEEIASVEITDLAGGLIAEFHSNHWDLASGEDALHLHPGDEMAVRIFFVAEDGDRFQLAATGEEHTLGVRIENPAVLTYDSDGDHGHFNALTAGETRAFIQVLHGGHEDWQTTPGLTVEVVDHAAH